MKKLDVVGLGALNMDYLYRVERVLRNGETVANTEHIERSPKYTGTELKWLGSFPGGSAANTIYGLNRLKINAGFIGTVGDDADGKMLLKDFKKAGVDTSQIKVKKGVKTGFTKCLSDKYNFRSIQVTPGANNLLTIDDLDLSYINQAEILHISSFVDDAQLEILLGLVKKLDSSVKISFSPGELYATRGIKALKAVLKHTYILFLNEKEIEQLTGKDLKKGAKACLRSGCQIVVVTLGKGTSWKSVMATSYIRDSQGEYVVEPADKEIISIQDTTGAGDAFAAGFLYGLLKDKTLDECGRLGDVVAKFSITRTGARQGLPTLSELSKHCRKLNIEV
jgi:ribokinase